MPSSLTLTLDGAERPASFGRANLLDQRIDLLRRQFPAEFGHAVHGKPPLAIGDDAVQVLGGSGGGFSGDERWPAEKVAPSLWSVTFGAVFLEDRICSQARVGWSSLGERCHKCEKQSGENDRELLSSQNPPPQILSPRSVDAARRTIVSCHLRGSTTSPHGREALHRWEDVIMCPSV